ncbi:primosomal protein N' [Phytoactinopolyspora alkaliphila]|uniref:Probable replication restart protein PriA n=1 Tax=Phytoactinopolyspora alkaliphila TaxID=1783498 RepID=A0A6N9YR23_9ACTN|nr:primosomal protein N' [Phytoactinopolyspora alkaliphila]
MAEDAPVARVLVDIGLAHLDRPFDYLVPASMADGAVPGARVRVRFAGADHDGFIVERTDSSEHTGRLSPLRRLVSPEPVLTPQVAQLARAVADRYAGTVADVLRLAVPPRHARTEKEPSPAPTPAPSRPAPGGWADHRHGTALLDALADARAGARPPRAVWNPGPAAAWPDLLARLVATTVSGGRGAVVVVPDARDVARLDTALRDVMGEGRHIALEADAGLAERYRRWLRALRGSVRAVVGTRSAAFAPVANLGLVAIWDDGDDLFAEPRAPYPHTREVLLLRAHLAGAAAVVGAHARTAEAQQLVETGWARAVEPERSAVRARAPQIHTVGDEYEQHRDQAARSARLPSLAWRVARSGLQRGPVLVQVARAGYVPALACARCRTPARCSRCPGGLRLSEHGGAPTCERCSTPAPSWQCTECGHGRLRAAVVGLRRTVEELGRAFPGVQVWQSGAEAVTDTLGPEPRLVVATHGAEPEVTGGYASALLLDGTSMLNRQSLRAAEEALRRWLRAAALVRSRPGGGEIVVVADPGVPAVQALVRWDPAGFAARELAERAQLHFPPAARVAQLRGARGDIDELLRLAELPAGAQIAGPDQDGDTAQALVRVPRSSGTSLAAALRGAAGVRSARRSGEPVRIQIDPADL